MAFQTVVRKLSARAKELGFDRATSDFRNYVARYAVRLTLEEEHDAFERGDEDLLARSQLAWVLKLLQASRLYFGYRDVDLLVSEAQYGLLQAIRNHNPERSGRLITAVTQYVVSAMYRVGTTSRAAKRYRVAEPLTDYIQDLEPLLDRLIRETEAYRLQQLLSILVPREREIVIRRAGGETLAAIGKSLELSKDRIRQLQNRAERQLASCYFETESKILFRRRIMLLEEFLQAGPERREQLTSEVYDLYRKFGFDPEKDTPEYVKQMLMTRPEKAYQVFVYHGTIKPEHRDSTTLSDGAVFRHLQDVDQYRIEVRRAGGIIRDVRERKLPRMWYETLKHYRNLGKMTVADIDELKRHWTHLVKTDERWRQEQAEAGVVV